MSAVQQLLLAGLFSQDHVMRGIGLLHIAHFQTSNFPQLCIVASIFIVGKSFFYAHHGFIIMLLNDLSALVLIFHVYFPAISLKDIWQVSMLYTSDGVGFHPSVDTRINC